MTASRSPVERSAALINEGNSLWEKGNPAAALARFREAHGVTPSVLTAYSIGMALELVGGQREAEASYRTAVALDPLRIEPRVNLGSLLRERDREEALHHHLIAYGTAPSHPQVLYSLALSYLQLNCGSEAGHLLARCCALDSDFSAARAALESIDLNSGRRLERVLESSDLQAPLTPATADRIASAVIYQSAIVFAPEVPAPWMALSRCYQRADLHVRAWDAALLATEHDSDSGEVWSHFEAMSRRLRRRGSCYKALNALLRIWPQSVSAMNNLAGMLIEDQRYHEAVALLGQAVELLPSDPTVWLNLANAHLGAQRPREAIDALARARAINPDDATARALLIATAAHSCDWSIALEQWEMVREDVRTGREPPVAPFLATAIPDITLADQLVISRGFVERLFSHIEPMQRGCPARHSDARIKVGYVSSEFRSHATTYLIAEMIELHDRARFEVIAFSSAPSDNSSYRSRIEAAFDKFIDVHEMTDAQAAEIIAEESVEILVDLNCYTGIFRPGIFAHRPAPIQVNFLGYPGTSGAKFMDYVIGDPVVTPEGCEPFFSEAIVRMPSCYQPNDRKRPLPPRAERRSVGLPDDGFVFCCFNQAFKLTPDRFEIWCRLLHAVPGSVLWLLSDSEEVQRNLRSEAGRHGVEATRLIFAPRLDLARHMGRFRCADLFLDTGPYNAHTTASDALWCGVPIVTKAGDTFASRVAASILSAVGLPELICTMDESYYDLALTLAQDPRRLRKLKLFLEEVRATCTLFDSQRFTRDLEALYIKMRDSKETSLTR